MSFFNRIGVVPTVVPVDSGLFCLERKTSQYVLSFMCDHCFEKTTWESSQDWKQPGSDRKFIESMTVCGINYWQYKRFDSHHTPSGNTKGVYCVLIHITTLKHPQVMPIQQYILFQSRRLEIYC